MPDLHIYSYSTFDVCARHTHDVINQIKLWGERPKCRAHNTSWHTVVICFTQISFKFSNLDIWIKVCLSQRRLNKACRDIHSVSCFKLSFSFSLYMRTLDICMRVSLANIKLFCIFDNTFHHMSTGGARYLRILQSSYCLAFGVTWWMCSDSSGLNSYEDLGPLLLTCFNLSMDK